MSTLSVTNVVSTSVQATELKSNNTQPPVVRNSSGVEVGWMARAWVNFNGTDGSIRASGNVSSVTRAGTGNYTINFSLAMPDSNYNAVAAVNRNGANGIECLQPVTLSTTTMTATVRNAQNTALVDCSIISVSFFR